MINLEPIAVAYDGGQYVGSDVCINCHRDISEQHKGTAHAMTSQKAEKENILGSFEPGHNIVELNNNFSYKMSENDGKLIQEAYHKDRLVYKAQFDIIVGSGTKGQTYLFWHNDQLYQLPVSYRVKDSDWVNSPNYSYDNVDFARPIVPICMECHSTFAKSKRPDKFLTENTYFIDEIIYGISCESCHGPSGKHAVFHINNPEEKTSKFMLNIGSLSRKRRLESCAKCHSGLREPLVAPFTFRTGDELEGFYKEAYTQENQSTLDVHGNQYGLLSSSRCFIESENMACERCHDPHENERGNLKKFSRKCIECHFEPAHTFKHTEKISDNCIDCHMPLQSSATITFKRAVDPKLSDSLLVRTHRIGIYDNVIEDLKKYIEVELQEED